MTLTLALTTYNRYEMLLESFAGVIDDPRIDEILIMDDASDLKYWDKIKELPKFNPKIKVIRQLNNRGMSVNKRDAVLNSKNEWVILFDSDNVIGKDYLDAIPDTLESNKIYLPNFARPQFDFQKYTHILIDAESAAIWIRDDSFNMMMNCCNYLVHRDSYVEAFTEDQTVKGSDTILFAYHWLKKGGKFKVVENMQYFHRVHAGSGFLADCDFNMAKAAHTRKLIELL
jgi:glycosyltransferase involved in cell wall biosynthesis